MTSAALVDAMERDTEPGSPAEAGLESISQSDEALRERFSHAIAVDPFLTRALVSYQNSKSVPAYRWFKYKEAFSPTLVEYLLREYATLNGRLLDPFAGSGAALFAAASAGWDADGVELLPIGQEIIRARLRIEREASRADKRALLRWINDKPWTGSSHRGVLPSLRITQGAYSPQTADSIERYLGAASTEPNPTQQILRFALLCVLEVVSFTRKDGQYLRWDYRSGRRQGDRPFDKGQIPDFDTAMIAKLGEIVDDMQRDGGEFLPTGKRPSEGAVRLFSGSCLEILPQLPDDSYDVILTSPPYCNRYDYTRTYALELALLGVDEAGITRLRQQMLSCTVENRAKDLLAINPKWNAAIDTANAQRLLGDILDYLEALKAAGKLNNSGVPRMVRGYFHEMACVIQECRRVLRPGGVVLMVNDNVRYAGAGVSVDLILSDFAQSLGLAIEKILVLPCGKGNSSQQMGEYGRTPLRKCVYVWRKP